MNLEIKNALGMGLEIYSDTPHVLHLDQVKEVVEYQKGTFFPGPEDRCVELGLIKGKAYQICWLDPGTKLFGEGYLVLTNLKFPIALFSNKKPKLVEVKEKKQVDLSHWVKTIDTNE